MLGGRRQSHILSRMPLHLAAAEAAALAEHLRRVFAADPFPRTPRVRTLRAILAKLDPVECPDPLPAPKAGERSMVVR